MLCVVKGVPHFLNSNTLNLEIVDIRLKMNFDICMMHIANHFKWAPKYRLMAHCIVEFLLS